MPLCPALTPKRASPRARYRTDRRGPGCPQPPVSESEPRSVGCARNSGYKQIRASGNIYGANWTSRSQTLLCCWERPTHSEDGEDPVVWVLYESPQIGPVSGGPLPLLRQGT